VKDPWTFSFHEYESIECRYDSINDLVMNHVSVCLFDGETSMMKSVQWLATFTLIFICLDIYLF
jgi:hypothetical protein